MKDLTKNVTWNNVNASNEQIKEYVKNYALNFNVHVTNLVINNGNVSFTTYSKVSYNDLVVSLIRKQYPVNEEFAILRKAINGITDEYNTYNAYVEQCKAKAKEWVTERDKALGA